jgi:hypothetical protein
VLIRVTSWIACSVKKVKNDPLNHTNGHEMKSENDQ